MKQLTILNAAIGSLKLSEEEYQALRRQLIEYEETHKFANAEDYAKGITNDFPHLRMLHDAAMRRYALVTAVNSSIVKIIIVIYFICSVLAAFIFALNSK